MRSTFPLFQSHLDLAHHYWGAALQAGDTVIDATCGNGHDTLALAQRVIPEEGNPCPLVHAIDIQQEAIESCRALLEKELKPKQLAAVVYHHCSHEQLAVDVADGSVAAVVYNLGYLPGGDKSRTTVTTSTLKSLEAALVLIKPGGIICVTCYPGHLAGAEEEKAVLSWSAHLDKKEYSCCHHTWTNRKSAPSLLLIQKHTTKT